MIKCAGIYTCRETFQGTNDGIKVLKELINNFFNYYSCCSSIFNPPYNSEGYLCIKRKSKTTELLISK